MKCECLENVGRELRDQMEVIILREVLVIITMNLSMSLEVMVFKMPIEEFNLMDEDADEWYKMSIQQRVVSKSWDAMRTLYALFLENDICVKFDSKYAYVPLVNSSLPKLARELLKLIKPQLYS
jgi:hypothetical protein